MNDIPTEMKDRVGHQGRKVVNKENTRNPSLATENTMWLDGPMFPAGKPYA